MLLLQTRHLGRIRPLTPILLSKTVHFIMVFALLTPAKLKPIHKFIPALPLSVESCHVNTTLNYIKC